MYLLGLCFQFVFGFIEVAIKKTFGERMKHLLITFILILSIQDSFAESQVVYFPASFKVPTEVQVFIDKVVAKNCAQILKLAEAITLVDFEVAYDEYDQGKVDTFYKVAIDVRYPGNDDNSDLINIIVEDADINNPNFPRLYLEGIKATGGVCRD